MNPSQPIALTITHNAALGDGVGNYHGLPVYVPYTVQGEEVLVEITHQGKDFARAYLREIRTPSPHRRAPSCEHFGSCGGCSMQHFSPDYYRHLKEAMAHRIVKELQQPAHILQPLREVGAGARRRVEWAVRVQKGAISLGYQLPKSHEVVSIAACPVALPALTALLSPLKIVLGRMKKATSIESIALTAVADGIDMIVHYRTPLNAADKALWLEFAPLHGVIRLALQQEGADDYTILYSHNAPKIMFGQLEVSLPVGAFLQASEVAQQMMTEMVQAHLQGCTHVADMYAGCGTYSFPMQSHAAYVTAYEGAPEMVAAMHNALSAHGLHDKMVVSCRDLFSNPVLHTALQHIDGVVINPPRNGALPQIKQLATSSVGRIVMISCNPATFIRDAANLIKGGYQLTALISIDQFVWSAHLEVVGLFVRA